MDIGNLTNYTDHTSALAAAQNADRLKNMAKTAQSEDEMLSACKEFEGYLWEQVIKSMKKTAEVFSEEEDSTTSKQVDYFMDTAITELAKQMTEQSVRGDNGNSLAMQMYEQMKRNQGLNYEQVLAIRNAAEAAGTEEAAESVAVPDGESESAAASFEGTATEATESLMQPVAATAGETTAGPSEGSGE